LTETDYFAFSVSVRKKKKEKKKDSERRGGIQKVGSCFKGGSSAFFGRIEENKKKGGGKIKYYASLGVRKKEGECNAKKRASRKFLSSKRKSKKTEKWEKPFLWNFFFGGKKRFDCKGALPNFAD